MFFLVCEFEVIQVAGLRHQDEFCFVDSIQDQVIIYCCCSSRFVLGLLDQSGSNSFTDVEERKTDLLVAVPAS